MATGDNDIMVSENGIPRHIAIIMDGNGRWAEKRFMPRAFGHQAGVKAVRKIVEHAGNLGVEVLTLFAFSSENWRRPKEEVSLLMSLFVETLQREIDTLDKNGVRLRFIGDRTAFPDVLQDKMRVGEEQTKDNKALTLVIAANYGGHWDICQAFQKVIDKMATDGLSRQVISPELIQEHLSTAGLPDPDLFIRTGGEERVSNFLLWQLAYTELYFTTTLWPDFDQDSLDDAINSFKGRQRRFGYTGEQILNKSASL
ncbi:ditrans,polycis-undecaprenyl-diphosphate synthase ((2E,6E)-farnesyl-diphosphate specific) [Methyloglobulus morosus KoM1]|uniref:Ditrans,polycis-undecaprenyl-diphosphate synthase ((2E,6E)-farnesyl-diphosphate specific) n=1 Tax=Methyloglobulus morosus KoM1 TaxID=1116472 RepID=V5BDN7_9GAMM|nr:isoprenyl transferase [Methyloglobulus morosus]ESS71415.1 ditrans,polycis-undecaprenyl-diphosphate synthase ((2E,6E)-farnesyl-diphosphate specific) [Methyloglobulus morosus KoM1]